MRWLDVEQIWIIVLSGGDFKSPISSLDLSQIFFLEQSSTIIHPKQVYKSDALLDFSQFWDVDRTETHDTVWWKHWQSRFALYGSLKVSYKNGDSNTVTFWEAQSNLFSTWHQLIEDYHGRIPHCKSFGANLARKSFFLILKGAGNCCSMAANSVLGHDRHLQLLKYSPTSDAKVQQNSFTLVSHVCIHMARTRGPLSQSCFHWRNGPIV